MKHIKIRFEENANIQNFNVSFKGTFLFEDNGVLCLAMSGTYYMLDEKLENVTIEEENKAEANTVSETTFLKTLAIMKGHVKNIEL